MVPRFSRCAVALRGGLCNSARVPLPSRRCLAGSVGSPPPGPNTQRRHADAVELWKKYRGVDESEAELDNVRVGFIGKRRHVGRHLSFGNLTMASGEVIQICSNAEGNEAAHDRFRQIPAHVPVSVRVEMEPPAPGQANGQANGQSEEATEASEETEEESAGKWEGAAEVSEEAEENAEEAEEISEEAEEISEDAEEISEDAAEKSEEAAENPDHSRPTFYLRDIRLLNSVSTKLVITSCVRFPQEKRHLQLRFHPELQARLRFRSWLKGVLNQSLLEKGFVEIETPTLFKSTPEGAREFLVPTRQRGKAYALSQSPQQYKQVLMASGFARYMQWARCYRDEDLRTDRQPEFSQLDMEWAFEGAAKVRQDVSDMIREALAALCPSQSYKDVFRATRVPAVADIPRDPATRAGADAHEFTTITFADSIAAYGTDKPDLRIPNRIHAIKDVERISRFVKMLTRMPDPLVEFFVFPLEDCSPKEIRKFITRYLRKQPNSLVRGRNEKPQVLIHDSSLPLNGFASLGHEYKKVLNLASGGKDIKEGDVVVFQARTRPTGQYSLGSTPLGELRSALWGALVKEGYMKKPPRLGDPGSLRFTWVTEFPMFKKAEPGQGGAAEIAAVHHPFTAPLSGKDLELLLTHPFRAKSSAYDLVLNGVEIGGGSERNHIVKVQEFILRDVLKLKGQLEGFSHLLDALRSGCPPHAGFALGFDRMVALMTDTLTVRDVMAFPKNMKGEDPFVGSPSELTDEQLAPYGLQLCGKAKA